MSDFSTQPKEVKAQKEHQCVAYLQILEHGYGVDDFKHEDWLKIQEMKKRNGMILKGEVYISWSGVFDGDFYHCKANKEMIEICNAYDLWGEV